MDRGIDLRSKCRHFRILSIGRANAGKTTLLKKVCNSIEDPEIFSPSGEKLDPSIVQESSERGMHDIENQLIFKSNPQFIFHDSRGFESGSLDEMQKVKSFISDRAQRRNLSEQLHAIWYCLPTDTTRPLLDADRKFFEEHCDGTVPVIAIFTKFDGLVTKAFTELREISNAREATKRKLERAKEMLNINFIDPLKAVKSRPSAYVRLDDMRQEASNCRELIDETANALNDETLKLLFISVQQNNIDTCTRYALQRGMEHGNPKSRISQALGCFPHAWKNFEYDEGRPVNYRLRPYGYIAGLYRELFDANVESCFAAFQKDFPELVDLGAETNQKLSAQVELLVVTCICAERTFVEGSAKEQGFGPAFSVALGTYVKSVAKDDVKRAVNGLVDGKDASDESLEQPLFDIIKDQRFRV